MGILILNLFHLKQVGDGAKDLFGSGWPAHISMG
jgi:hypothetical protein